MPQTGSFATGSVAKLTLTLTRIIDGRSPPWEKDLSGGGSAGRVDSGKGLRRRAGQAEGDRHRGGVGESVEKNQQEGDADPVPFPDREHDRAQEIDGEEYLGGEREVSRGAVLLVSPFSAASGDPELGRAGELRLAVRQGLDHGVQVVERQADPERKQERHPLQGLLPVPADLPLRRDVERDEREGGAEEEREVEERDPPPADPFPDDDGRHDQQ